MTLHEHECYISLPEELGEEIGVVASYTIENDGIGSYEYWGQKCYDAGTDYPEVQDIDPIWTDQDLDTTASILEYIVKNWNSKVEEVSVNIESYEPDYDD